MRKVFLLTAAMASIGFAANANAYTISISTAPNWAVFDDIATGSSNFTDDGIVFSGTGMVENGSVENKWAAPLGDTSNYMAVLKGEAETLTLPSPKSSLLIYWGSIDGNVGEFEQQCPYVLGRHGDLGSDAGLHGPCPWQRKPKKPREQ